MKTEFIFHSQIAEDSALGQELIKLVPYGVSIATDLSRPILILKDEKGELSLPVAINPLEAGVALSQSQKSEAPVTPHRFTALLMTSLNITLEKCVFAEIKGHHQYVRLYVKGHPDQESFKIRADEAMSLCLYQNIPLYATRDFMHKSKIMSAELEGLEKSLIHNRQILDRNQPYIM